MIMETQMSADKIKLQVLKAYPTFDRMILCMLKRNMSHFWVRKKLRYMTLQVNYFLSKLYY